MKKCERYRDPVHGFIEVRPLEKKIIDTEAFQRLRNIKQLAMTYLVFHGAEHTRFGHSIGVMHLASRAFRSALQNSAYNMDDSKIEWYDQILRLIALTHDLGHAPFSHAAEAVFPDGLSHEDFTEKIIKDTEIAEIINEIGEQYKETYGDKYDITPDLICKIYSGREAGENGEFILLKTFMDSELDCDKMDYLLRDSMYCGVNYGNYDVDRLISSLTIYEEDGNPRLAIDIGGVQAFEEFVLARYFMFIQVYFHRTRRYFDIMYARALKKILPEGKFPEDTFEYMKWDDCRIINLMKDSCSESEECLNIIKRIVYPRVLRTKTHPIESDKREYKIIKNMLYQEIGEGYFIEDCSADKMPHKIPSRTEISDEKAIIIVDRTTGKRTTISEESHIIKSLTEKIDIMRIYVDPKHSKESFEIVKNINKGL
ncbi:MAG: HD domain-containing protein [Tissierellaceae bacterium]